MLQSIKGVKGNLNDQNHNLYLIAKNFNPKILNKNTNDKIVLNQLDENYSFLEYQNSDGNFGLKISGTENVSLFLYDLIFNKKNSFEFHYVADSSLADFFYKIFGKGFWVKKDKINIIINDLIFSYDLKLKSSDRRVGFSYEIELSKNLRYTYPKLYSKISESDNSFEDVIKIINNYLMFAIPTSYDSKTKNFNEITVYQPMASKRVGTRGAISDSRRLITFEVEGIKSHNGEVFISAGASTRRIDAEVNYSNDNRFEIKISHNPNHGFKNFYLTNKFNNITTYQLIAFVQSDFNGPTIDMGYYVNNSYAYDGPTNGKAAIKVGTWEGLYKPLTVSLSGDIERLYIDGKRFNFDPNENPQEIFRRFPIESYIGFNRTEIIAYDKRNNKTVSKWEFDAKRVGDDD